MPRVHSRFRIRRKNILDAVSSIMHLREIPRNGNSIMTDRTKRNLP